jgi:hypothetical protein
VATSNSRAFADACAGEAVAGDAVAGDAVAGDPDAEAAVAGACAGAAGAPGLCAAQLIETVIAKKERRIRNDFTGTLARADDEVNLEEIITPAYESQNKREWVSLNWL